MNTQILKTLRCILCLVLVLGMLPLAALADTGNLGTGTPDGTPPVLTSLTLSATTVNAPGEIEVTATATDDVSGVAYVHLSFRCEETDKGIGCELTDSYWDPVAQKYVPYPDGKLHGTITVESYIPSGTYKLFYIEINDRAGNGQSFADPTVYDAIPPIPDFAAELNFQVVNESSGDITAPVLTELTLSATSVVAPGEIEITAAATDDISGTSDVMVYFSLLENKKINYSCQLLPYYEEGGRNVLYPDGKLHGTMKISPYILPGTLQLMEITTEDYAGNRRLYELKYELSDPEFNSEPMPDFVTQRTIQVSNPGTPDITPPALTGLTLSTSTMAAPGQIEVIIDTTDDVSGIFNGHIDYRLGESDKNLSCLLQSTYWDEKENKDVPYPDGKLHGFLDVDQYTLSGNYVLRVIYLEDHAGNDRHYAYSPDKDLSPEIAIPGFITQRVITVLNATADVTTSVAKPEFVDQVKGAKEDAYIVADYSGNATLPGEAFTAIAGTDKTLDLVSDGVTWRFNGKDIVNDVKPIGLNVTIKPVEEHPSDAAKDIQSALKDQPAVVMQFPENGQLPGKATIQVKVDHAMREYLGGDRNLCVYYYNNETGKLELVAKDLVVINDTFVEFSITHCSNYVLTMGDSSFPFTDVPNDAWYLQPVQWAVANGITNGMTDTTFAPDGTCTRAQIVTFLWRANGSPKAASANNPFTDIPAGQWYTDAVLWAVEKGITTGTSATTFSPDDGCTRGQVATFLWRAQGKPTPGGNNIFTDIASGAYYYDAVLWAVEKKVTNGMGDGLFAPDATCTRGQIVTFLYRAMV